MVRIAVVDDEAQERETLNECFGRLSKELGEPIEITEFHSGDEFLKTFSGAYDMICLDIDMPGKNGIDTAAAVREQDEEVLILFITNMAQMAIRGYEVWAWDFLLKPINEYSFAMKMKNAFRVLKRRYGRAIVVPGADGMEMFPSNDLLYAEVQGHYIYYHTKTGTSRQKGSLKELEKKLDGLPFSRCNQCYLINLNHVSSIRGDKVYIGADWLKISRSRKKTFLNELSKHLGGLV